MPAITFYHRFKENQLEAPIDHDGDTIKASLHTSAYTPSASAHDFFDDVTNEVTGTNYTAGGTALANKVVTLTSGEAFFDADDVTWAQHASGFSNARYVVLRKDTGTASTSTLIGYMDLVTDRGNTGDAFAVQWNASGVYKLA